MIILMTLAIAAPVSSGQECGAAAATVERHEREKLQPDYFNPNTAKRQQNNRRVQR
jgi:hypothetical protein